MRKKQQWKRLTCFLLIAATAISCAGCKKTETSDQTAELPVYEALDNPDKEGFYISLFGDPAPITLENYQKVKDCGFRTIYLDGWFGNTYNSEGMGKALELCEEVGLDALIMLNNTMGTTDDELQSFSEVFKVDYTQYPAFKGIYAFDEPRISQMDWIAEDLEKWQSSKYKDYIYFVNLMSYGPDGEETSEYVQAYWDKVLSKNKDKYLVCDAYPLVEKNLEGKFLPRLADNLLKYCDGFSGLAKEEDATFITFIQTWSAPQRGTCRELVSVNDFRFQCAYNLAYGSQGFICFTYYQFPQFSSAMTGFDGGELTDYWYWGQEVFQELKEWEHVYFAFDYEGTLVLEGTREGYGVQTDKQMEGLKNTLKEHERIEKIDTEYDLVVGTFKDKDKNDGFLFASFTDPYYMKNNEISVTFEDATRALIYHNGKLVTNDDAHSCYILNDGVLKYTLEAGDYMFVIPVK